MKKNLKKCMWSSLFLEMFLEHVFKGTSAGGCFRWRWFYDVEALREILRVKHKKHLKTAEFVKNAYGLSFQQSWRLKAGKFTDQKYFLMYFYGPF